MMYKDEKIFRILFVSFFIFVVCFIFAILFDNNILFFVFMCAFVGTALGLINIPFDMQRIKDENEEYYQKMNNPVNR